MIASLVGSVRVLTFSFSNIVFQVQKAAMLPALPQLCWGVIYFATKPQPLLVNSSSRKPKCYNAVQQFWAKGYRI